MSIVKLELPENRTKSVRVVMTGEEKAQLEELSRLYNTSKSEVVRQLIKFAHQKFAQEKGQ